MNLTITLLILLALAQSVASRSLQTEEQSVQIEAESNVDIEDVVRTEGEIQAGEITEVEEECEEGDENCKKSQEGP